LKSGVVLDWICLPFVQPMKAIPDFKENVNKSAHLPLHRLSCLWPGDKPVKVT
jgi:hypothetical protein